MADAVARREARRRRILENSQNRLQRITGRNDYDETENNLKDQDESTDIDTLLGMNDVENEHTLISNMYNTSNTSYYKYNNTNNVGSYGSSLHKRLDARTETTVTEDTHNNLLRPKENDITKCHLSKSENTLLLYKLLKSRSSYILLAAIVNILMALNLDDLFGKAITIPYFLMVFGRISIFEKLEETQNGSLLFAALILCNVKPEITYRLKMMVSVSSIIISDLALYIFSFILMHCGLSYCFYDSANFIPSNV